MEATTTTMAIELGFAGVVFAFIIGIACVSWALSWMRPAWGENVCEWEAEFEVRPCGDECECDDGK